MRISDWSSDVCSSDLELEPGTFTQRFRDAQGQESPHLRAGAEAQCRSRHLGRRHQGGDRQGPGSRSRRFHVPSLLVQHTRNSEGLDRSRLCVWSFLRSEEHTSELQSLMRISYAVFCLKKQKLTYHT